MKREIRIKMASALLCGLMVTGLAVPASAASPTLDEAADRMVERQIMVGDQNGNMNLDQPLNRAQLAVIVSRLNRNPDHVEADRRFYESQCWFDDVPDRAKVHVGVCVSNDLLSGYGNGKFGPYDPVTPAAACTVILRWLERDGWTYSTACEKAVELELAPQEIAAKETLTRGDMAILLYHATNYMDHLQQL